MGNNNDGSAENTIQEVTSQTTEIAVDVAKGATTGNWTPLIVKVAIALIAIGVFFIIFVSCLFDVIFAELGFTDATSYTGTMYEAETENINTGLVTIYGSSPDTVLDNLLRSLIAIEEEEIKDLYENEKASAELRSQESTAYETYSTIIYEDYNVNNPVYGSNFWSSHKYVDYFSPIIQNYASDEMVHWVENGLSAHKSQINTFLKTQIENGEWFSFKSKDDTVKTVTEKKKNGKKYYYEYTGTATSIVGFDDLDAKYYENDLTEEQLAIIDMDSFNWDYKWEYTYKDVEITYITKNYELTITDPGERIGLIGGYDYKKIGQSSDEQNEKDLNLAIEILKAIEEGKFGDIVGALWNGGVEAVKNIFSGFVNTFQKTFSYRDIVQNSNVMAGFGYVGGNEDSIYAYLRDLGYSHAGACGIMGNMKQENSSFDPSLVDSNGYYGLFCIKDARYNRFISEFCPANGLEPNSVKAQLDYIDTDILKFRGDKNGAKLINVLRNTSDVTLAAYEFCVGYEGCIRKKGEEKAFDLPYHVNPYTGESCPGNIFISGEQNYSGRYYQELKKRLDYALAYDVKYSSYSIDWSELKSSSDVVAYAMQFVGNSYVWGGDSLSNGIDCSHFVWRVLQHTDHYDGGWIKSTYWKDAGVPVASLADALPGDILSFNGHVGIYAGDGTMVHAKGKAYGIVYETMSSSRINSILGISRFYPCNTPDTPTNGGY